MRNMKDIFSYFNTSFHIILKKLAFLMALSMTYNDSSLRKARAVK